MDDKTKLVDTALKIPRNFYSAYISDEEKDLREFFIQEIQYNAAPNVFKYAINAAFRWEQADEKAARAVGRKLGDLGEAMELASKDSRTPQEHRLFGSSNVEYMNAEPYKPICLRDLEVFREPRPELYGKVNEQRQKEQLCGYLVAFGDAAKARGDALNIYFEPVPLSVEELDENGRTVADPIIIHPAFVDVEIDKAGGLPMAFAREPMKVVSGEVLYKRLVEKNGYQLRLTMASMDAVMTSEDLRSLGFQEYTAGHRLAHIGKVFLEGKPMLLGYGQIMWDGNPIQAYGLENRPELSVKKALVCPPCVK